MKKAILLLCILCLMLPLSASAQSAMTIKLGGASWTLLYDETMFSLDTVNCSTSSQDLFYDKEFIRAFSQKKIKPENIIIILGYYDLFRDISLEKKSGLEIVKMV